MHRTVAIKVNAWVDEKVVPLVEALNQFPCVVTLDSCQGDAKKPAHVMFKYIGNGGEAAFFHEFGKALGKKAASVCEYDFRLQWLTGHDQPLAQLRTDPSSIDQLAHAIMAVATTSRRSLCSHDSRGKKPRCSTAVMSDAPNDQWTAPSDDDPAFSDFNLPLLDQESVRTHAVIKKASDPIDGPRIGAEPWP